MLKRFKSVGMLLCLSTLSTGLANAIPMSIDSGIVQQDNVCKGIVKDSNGETVIGASVVIKGTTNGTITGLDGDFQINNVRVGDIIEISFVGYITQTVKWTGGPINVKLKEDTKTLEEVVVVGYGIQKKANLSGSVAQVDQKQLESRPIQNLSSGLQGLMPGVTVTGASGAPGMDGGNIRVRGTGTLNAASPYILIDGVESESMNSVDPSDIESISVLKDASSAAIYGSKAANGVILITTKRGSTGKPKITYSGYVSVQNPTALVDRMGSYEYATKYNELLRSQNKSPRFTDEEIQKFKDGNDPLYPDTDWYDLVYRTGVQHRHNVNITGGSENSRYMASVGYLNQKGVLPHSGREQFNGRTNLDMKLTKRLTAKLNLSYIKNRYTDPSSPYRSGDGSFFQGGGSYKLMLLAGKYAPWIVARYPDGTWGTGSEGSPVAWLDSGIKVIRDDHNFTGTASLDYKIADFLKLTATGAYVNNFQDYKYFSKLIQYNPNKTSEPSSLTERNTRWDRTNFDLLLNYDQTFGQHNLKGLAGWHTEKYNFKLLEAYRKDFPNNDLTDMNAGDASSQTNSSYSRELAMLSWFARLNYDFAGKYLFEANIRADASSRFADGNRWGYFPSFSGAWRISEESFMEGASSWLSSLKLRASWGTLGNQDALKDFYPAINTYDIGANYPFNGVLNSGYYHGTYRLNSISWEKSATWGIGLDYALFNNKITGSIDFYNRKTTGILMRVSVPNEFGLKPYMDNVGKMNNKGVELNIAYKDKWGDWSFGAAANFAYNKNEILDLGGVQYLDGAENHRNAVGSAFGAYYLYKADGFFNSQEEATAYQKKYGNPFGAGGFKAGDLRYVDVNNDGKLNGKDRIMTNSNEPAFTFGLNLNTEWKGFDLSLMFNGAAKAERLFNENAYGSFMGDVGHPSTVWRGAWTESNHNATMPRIAENLDSPSLKARSTFWLEDISYIRLKNLQLGYTLPKDFLNSIGVEHVRFYYSVENVFTIDNLRINTDPEIVNDRLASYPLLRTHAFGVNVTF